MQTRQYVGLSLVAAATLALFTVACSSDGVGKLASAAKVSDCQEECDTQRFFDCYDAAQHAGCYDDCASATSGDIDKFVGCVEAADFCDVECSTNIEGRSDEVPEEDRVVTEREPEPEADSCQTACAAMAADMCIPEDCSPLCAEDAEVRFAIVYCNSVREGCEFPEECSGKTSSADACAQGCDQLQFFDCLSAGDAAACRNECAATDEATQTNFASCVQSSGTCDGDCYTIINPDGPSADVAGCQSACDDLSFFDCVDAQGLSDCRTTCETASRESVETFKSCAEVICEDDSCYQQLLSAN